MDALEAQFSGLPTELPPLAPAGTPFQRDVWAALLDIPRGTTISYGELARRLGAPNKVRAVAAAVGRNPMSVFVPCHRVVGADGALTGYAGGLGRKAALLALEAGQALTYRRMLRGYQALYSNPISVHAGEHVRWIDRPDDGEYLGWKWARAASGLEGWVPRPWFGPGDDGSIALRDYSARELTLSAGAEVLELDQYSGWLWVCDLKRRTGWVPAADVAPAPTRISAP